MQLRQKIIAILASVVGAYGVSDVVLKRMTVLSYFKELEEASAQKTTVAVKGELEDELQVLEARCLDWAQGDGTAEYLEGVRPWFADRRLADGVLQRESLDLVWLIDADGMARWGRCVNPDQGRIVPASELTSLPAPGEHLADQLLMGWRQEDRMRGLVRAQTGFLDTELGPLLISTQLVPPSTGEGGSSGLVILGRFVSRMMIEEIEQATEATGLQVRFHDPALASKAERDFVVHYSGNPLIEARDDKWLQVYHLVETQVGAGVPSGSSPAPLLLRADVPRDIMTLGTTAVNTGVVSTVIAGLVLLWVLIGLLQKIVLNPISNLMTNAVRVGEDDTADVRFDLERADEIGVLSREFDHMMEKLAASRAALVGTAREAGKSEIATGILHNVGNVLNSVNVSSSMLAKKADDLAVADLEALNRIIAEHAEDLGEFMSQDPRGEHFSPFLDALTQQLARGKEGIAEEIKSLSSGIDRIRDLVNSQQDYVCRTEVIESVDLAALVEEALAVSESADSYQYDFEVVREYAELPRCPIDRHKTLEVLVNLIQNARHAMEGQDGRELRLTLRLSAPDDESVRIEVDDTGHGIVPEITARIFDHGFTTRANGHGFGLHSAANAVTEMNGSLTAQSDGPGCGASFVLELPTRVFYESGAQS
jgi:signal transduction histidine kinase